MIEIITWFNDIHDADLSDVMRFAKSAQTPGCKVEMVEDDDIEPYGVAVVVYTGKGTEEELLEAFKKAWNGG